MRKNTVGIFALNNFALMSFAATVEPMRAANDLAGENLFDLQFFYEQAPMITSSGAANIHAQRPINTAEGLDYLFIVAGGRSEELLSLSVAPLLRELARKNRIMVGVSGGPLLLAQAGLMKNRRLTVHWEHAPTISRIAPEAMLEKSLYVIDRDRITCAGGIAPMDMTHQMMRKMYGQKFAYKVSDWFLHTQIRPSENAQQASLSVRYNTQNRTVISSIELMRAHIADPLKLEELAEYAHLSPRQLCRLFRKHVEVSVMAFYLDLRLEYADELLKNAHLSKTEIALATGFSSSAHFATAYRKKYGKTPSATFFSRNY